MKTSRLAAPADQIAFSSLLSGAWASAAVALFFLVIDGSRGDPLFTPSFLGSLLFTGQTLETVSGIRMDLVAAYSLIHFIAFAGIGFASTLLYVGLEPLRRQPALLGGAIMAFLSLAALGADLVFAPGLLDSLGFAWVILANGLAAGVMTWFIRRSVVACLPDAAPTPVRSQKSRPPHPRD